MLVDRRLQVTKKKGTASGLTMKTLEGTLAYVDENGKEKKVRLLSPLRVASKLSLWRAGPGILVDQVRRAGRGGADAVWSLQGDSRECHLLPSGGVQLDRKSVV